MKHSSHTTGVVHAMLLTFQQEHGEATVAVGSDAWFGWLEQATSFTFRDEAGHFTARKTRAGNQRGGTYWRASRRLHGRLASYYLGPSARLTPERLRQAAHALSAHAGEDHLERPAASTLPRHPLAQPTRAAPGLAPPHSLPRPLSRLLGRESERAQLVALLRHPAVRLLTLTGPGGVGKTHLALSAAQDLLSDFADGVSFVPLSAISESAFVLPAMAQALGLRETGARPLLEELQVVLSDRSLLLLLDNFEQVLPAAPPLADLLAVCPQVKLLVTSRVALRLQGEHELAVFPLALPDLAQVPTPESLLQYGACALFVERVQAIQPDFAVTQANTPAIAAICQRLDGLPLAIELAAARTRLLSPQALLARLSHRLDVLTGGTRNAPARQQTMRATIAWSYQLLAPEQQQLFRWLAVFAGGCDLAAVEAIAHPAGLQARHVLDGVSVLLENHLLRQVEQQGGEPRLLMLETIREYGRECLESAGEREAVRTAHAAYYLRLAEEAAPHLHGAEQAGFLARLEREQENLRAALGSLLELAQVQADAQEGVRESERALCLGVALHWFWYERGSAREGQAFLERALARREGVAPQLRARALYAAAELAAGLDEMERVETWCGEGLSLSREVGDTAGIASSLRLLGSIARGRGQYALAGSRLEEAAVLFGQLDDRWMQGRCHVELARTATEQGLYERARALLSDNLQFCQQAGNQVDVHWVQYLLARLLFVQQAELPAAQRLVEQSLAFFQERGYPWHRAYMLTLLAQLRLAQGEVAQAREWLEESLLLVQEVGDREGLIEPLLCLAYVALAQGDPTTARRRYQEVLTILHEMGSEAFLAACLEGLAALETEQEAPRPAAWLWGAAEALREAIGAPLYPVSLPSYGHARALARAQLGEQAFGAAWAQGRLMTPQQALAAQQQAMLATARPAGPLPLPAMKASPFPAGLTAREVEVLRLLAQGWTDAQIAEHLVISVRTVNRHTTSLYSKLAVSSRAAATRAAMEHHLL